MRDLNPFLYLSRLVLAPLCVFYALPTLALCAAALGYEETAQTMWGAFSAALAFTAKLGS